MCLSATMRALRPLLSTMPCCLPQLSCNPVDNLWASNDKFNKLKDGRIVVDVRLMCTSMRGGIKDPFKNWA